MELYQHQVRAVEFLRSKKRGILAFPMGLGKTACALKAMGDRHLPVLVVCPASVRMVWEDEVKKWRPDLSVCVVSSGKQNVEKADVVVTSYSLASALKLVAPSLLIFDEAHYLQSRQAARTKWATAAVAAVGRVWLLTGTPMFSSPRSIWTLMGMVGLLPPRYEKSYFRFADRFCAAYYNHNQGRMDDRGASNLQHLRRLLAPGMYREEKSVLDLPIKVRQMIRLDAKLGEMERMELKDAKPSGLTTDQAATVIRQTGINKIPAAVAHIKDILKSEEKVVLFAWNTDVIDLLMGELATYGAVKLDGRTTPKNKARAVREFQTGTPRVFIGQTVAAGVGITLTAARVALMVQTDWTASVLNQAEDRIHRIGQDRSVLVQYLVTKGSIEESQVAKAVKQMDYHDKVVVQQGAE